MQIESLIKPSRAAVRNVDVQGQRYVFAEVAKGRFVAEVANEDHAAILLANPKLFTKFTDKVSTGLQKPAAPAPAAQQTAPPPATTPPPASTDGQQTAPPATSTPPAGDAEADLNAAARALLQSTPAAIKKQLDKKPPSKAVLELAIKIESEQPNKRDSVLNALKGHLSAKEG